MTAKLDQLEQEIALAERAAAEATKANHAAGVELARTPASAAALQGARDAAQKLAAAEADLDMLRKARVAAQTADDADAKDAARAKAVGHLEAAERLQVERIQAAAKIDEILDTLKAACADWNSLCTEMRTESHAFFKITVGGRGSHDYSISVTASEITGAMAAELDTATHGMNDHHALQFSYMRHHAGQPERATDAAQCMGNVLLTRMREVAKQQGLLK